ncbi:SixA phosphatase family protein [Bowmanella dokdonensis]|uniref:Histidine phosphatase family protein n=1 Tax=Bowmanella dokdonensis TaxID=751969 RepID=A0A939ISW7_9ALTE|nr:histidine phosphatase family protein [Bowmanella dokdonensis]MBN7826861.1 histidine phosphatase family protein [Bowmanella dokdonensis]
MKSLLLVRHAKSSWKFSLDDEFRPLSARGYRDAPRMARELEPALPDLVLCSPAVRTYSTALFYLRAADVSLDKLRLDWALYEASGDKLLRYLLQVEDQYRHLWLFGHNPGLNELLFLLGGKSRENLPTGARLRLSWKTDRWAAIGQETPQMGEMVYPSKEGRTDKVSG